MNIAGLFPEKLQLFDFNVIRIVVVLCGLLSKTLELLVVIKQGNHSRIKPSEREEVVLGHHNLLRHLYDQVFVEFDYVLACLDNIKVSILLIVYWLKIACDVSLINGEPALVVLVKLIAG